MSTIFFCKHVALTSAPVHGDDGIAIKLRSESKDWLTRNQIMCPSGATCLQKKMVDILLTYQ
jgi:hypothetical protein